MSRMLLLALLAGALIGCGNKKESTFSYVGAKIGGAGGGDARIAREAEGRPEQAQAPPAAKPKEAASKPVQRKMIYTAQMDVIVEDLDVAATELLRLLDEHKGYRTHSNVEGTPGTPRAGTWTVRVPAERFEEFRQSLNGLGEVRRTKVDSDDVTDRYYDAKANIKTLQVEEEGLQKLYLSKSPSSKLDELVVLRREMRDLRKEIERLQGQMQRWDEDVAFSTATITLRDRKDYVPPLLPDFNSRIGRTFTASVDALVWTGQALLLLVVALAPWLLVLAILGAPVAIIYRVRSRSKPNEPSAGA